MLDLLIQNGLIVDGSGSKGYPGSIAVSGNRIVDIGLLESAQADQVIDASGQVVTPGFVDMHSHADLSLPVNPTADSLVHQGITTIVAGHCGMSPAPLLETTRELAIAAMSVADVPIPWEKWDTFGSYLDFLAEIGVSLNVVPLVGQGTVRGGVMGFSPEPANQQQMALMKAEVEKAMDCGAIGVSTGLIYPPGSFSGTEELVELVRPVGKRGGLYFSHVRGEDETLLDAIAEAIHIGRETGASVQISHLKAAGRANWNKAEKALEMIDKARGEGLDVTADMYPYLASSTGMAIFLPEWAHEGGNAAIFRRLADPVSREQIKRDPHFDRVSRMAGWDQVLICYSPLNTSFEGKTVAELADSAGKPAFDWILDALYETELELDMVAFIMSEDNLKLQLGHPAVMIGSDSYGLAVEGPLAKGVPHPRNFGTFPRVLGRYVREEKTLSLEEAVWKMSGFPAKKLGWKDRGLIRKGYQADLVVLDPGSVTDLATYQAPHQYPAGIRHVIVNGVPVIRDGVHTLARPGSVI